MRKYGTLKSIISTELFFLGYDNIDAKTQSDKPCVFPFTYGKKNLRKKYYHCTPVGHNQPWCATEVDANGNYIYGRYKNCEIKVWILSFRQGIKC